MQHLLLNMVQQGTEKSLIDWVMFGQWMRNRRDGKGLSQEAAAEAVKIHPQTWYRLEKGDGTKPSTMRKIARFLATDDADFNQILAAVLGPLSAPSPSMKEDQEKARRNQASRLSEIIDIVAGMPPDQQAQILAIIKILGAEHPETLQIINEHADNLTPKSPHHHEHYESEPGIKTKVKGGRR